MGRLKGNKNKSTTVRPVTSSLSLNERVQLLANIIVDRILDDQKNGQIILKKLNIQ